MQKLWDKRHQRKEKMERTTLNREDNLLIYYAGHGMYIKEQEQGYWLPVDSDKNKRSKWINNQTVVAEVKSAEAKHILLIVDSCFAASLTKSTTIDKNLRKKQIIW